MTRSERIHRILRCAIKGLCAFLLLWILGCLFFCYNQEYSCYTRKYFPSNPLMILLIALLIASWVLIKKKVSFSCKGGFRAFTAKNFLPILAVGSLLLFVLELCISRHIYFYTGGDVKGLTDTALSASFEDGLSIDFSLYTYKRYPNNLALTLIFVFIKRICDFLGTDPYFGFIVGSCLCITLACFFTALCVEKLTKNRNVALLVWVMSIILCGLSPWMTIPYSDSYGILFPVTSLFLYLSLRRAETLRSRILLGIGFGAVSVFGYLIKPSAIVVFIAVVIIETLRFLFKKETRKKILTSSVAVLLSAVAIFGTNTLVMRHFDLYGSPEQFGMTHWFMMGLNERTNGNIAVEDVDFSAAIEDPDERTSAEIQVAIERIKEKGASGMLRHTMKKTMTNFNDGRFGWGFEGPFYREMLPEKNGLSSFLRKIYYPSTGEYLDESRTFEKVNSIAHFIWLLSFALNIIALLWKKKGERWEIGSERTVLWLALVGHILFVMLFEARGRYSFIYSPLVLVGASLAIALLANIKKTDKKVVEETQSNTVK